MLDKLIYWLSRPVIGLYGHMLELDVLRHSKLPKGPKIIAPNHPSTSDPFLVAWISREPARMLVTHHAFEVPVFGAYLRTSGHIPVVEGEGRQAFETARQHLMDGGTIIIFPEGDLSPRGGGFREPRTGAARLSLLTGAPVIPVGVGLRRKGLWHLESDIGGDWVTSRWALHGPYGITVGEPVTFEGDIEDRPRVRAISQQIMKEITALARESEERIERPPSLLSVPFEPRPPMGASG